MWGQVASSGRLARQKLTKSDRDRPRLEGFPHSDLSVACLAHAASSQLGKGSKQGQLLGRHASSEARGRVDGYPNAPSCLASKCVKRRIEPASKVGGQDEERQQEGDERAPTNICRASQPAGAMPVPVQTNDCRQHDPGFATPKALAFCSCGPLAKDRRGAGGEKEAEGAPTAEVHASMQSDRRWRLSESGSGLSLGIARAVGTLRASPHAAGAKVWAAAHLLERGQHQRRPCGEAAARSIAHTTLTAVILCKRSPPLRRRFPIVMVEVGAAVPAALPASAAAMAERNQARIGGSIIEHQRTTDATKVQKGS